MRKNESFSPSCKILRIFPIFFLLALTILSFSPAPRQSILRFQHIGVDDGLSDNRVFSITQDKLGFLWIGTQYGLLRYDGYSFAPYHHQPGNPNSISDKWVWDTYNGSRSGNLWIMTIFGLDRLDPHTGKITHVSVPTTFLQGHEMTMIETSANELWLCTNRGELIRIDCTTLRPLPLPGPLQFLSSVERKYSISRICEDASGDIWIATANGLFRYTPSTNSSTLIQQGLIKYICFDDQWAIWILSDTSLDRLDPVNGKRQCYPPLENSKELGVNAALADRWGWLWFATTRGLQIFDRHAGEYLKLIRIHDNPDSPLKERIPALCEDYAGNMWIATRGNGLFKFNRRFNQFNHIGYDPNPGFGFRAPYVRSILEDGDGIIWIGTYLDGLYRHDHQSLELTNYSGIQLKNTSRPNPIDAILKDSSGNLWIGSGHGLALFDRRRKCLLPFTLKSIPPLETPFIPQGIVSILEDGPDTLCIGTSFNGLFQINKNRHSFTPFPKTKKAVISELPYITTAIYRDHADIYWICTNSGLIRFDPSKDRIHRFSAEPKNHNGLSGNFVTGAVEDRNGNLWVSTDQGLNLLDRQHGTFRAYTRQEGLCENYLRSVIEDADGFLWVSHNQGISRFDPRRHIFRNFGKTDGVTLGGAYVLANGRDNKVLATGFQGAIIFDPREVVKTNTHVPPMYFSALRVGDREVPLHHVFSQCDQAKETGRVTMRPGERMLSVEFAALDFSAPEKNQYAFRIEEQGGKWNDLGTRRQITFSNLGVGEHTLRIKGSNNDGVWNEKGVALRIEVLPALWQTWWFKLLALFLLAGAALLIFAVCRTIASLKKIVAPPNLDEIFNKHKISHREQEILHLVIQGKSNREMEQMLYISLPTVKRHLANIYEKIGVSSRLQLINFLQGRKPRY